MAKKIILILFLSAFFSSVSPAGSALAVEDPATNLQCWKRADCAVQRANMASILKATDKEVKMAGEGWVPEEPCTGDWGKCLPPNVATTQIAFAGQNRFLNIGDFIFTMYKYLVGIAGIVAVAMIVVAGVQWTASGGNSEMITSAKKRIGGALIGLMLAYLSYSLLSFINPALVNLRLPQVYMLRTPEQVGKESGEPCDTDKDCLGGLFCMGATNPPLVEGLNVFGSVLVAATAITVAIPYAAGAAGFDSSGAAIQAGVTAVKGAPAAIGKGAVSAGKAVTGFATKNFTVWKIGGVGGAVVGCSVLAASSPVGCYDVAAGTAKVAGGAVVGGAKAAGSGAVSIYEFIKSIGANGVCMKEANKDVRRGGPCTKNEHCISGYCMVNPKLGLIGGKNYGLCSTRENGSICLGPNDCKKGFRCIDEGRGVPVCSDGNPGAPCAKLDGTDTCHAPSVCVKVAGGDHICVSASAKPTSRCNIDADCGATMKCVSPDIRDDATPFCKDVVNSPINSFCYTDAHCASGQKCYAKDSQGNVTENLNANGSGQGGSSGQNLGACKQV